MKPRLYSGLLPALICLLILGACGDKMPLPSVQSNPESFGANDTTYIQLNPHWDAENLGYSPANPMMPVDMAIGQDEYIFIADKANDRVLVVNKAGNIETKLNLNNIHPIENPTGVAIDEKLNLLIVNGTNKIYVWNQYLNNIGVDSIFIPSDQNQELTFEVNAGQIDSVLGIYTFYEDKNKNSRFNNIAFGPENDNVVFVSDSGNNRIIELNLAISGAVKLKNSFPHPLFTGIYIRDIAGFGSGAGTVDSPRSIISDDESNIYFTQLSGNFLVQKLSREGSAYYPAYTLYQDPIMDLERFKGPYDLALGPDESIFILDTADSGKVSVFYNRGVNAGKQDFLGNEGLAVARFENPHSIAISEDGVVYIAHTGLNRIDRYAYTISDDDLPDENRN